MKFYMFRTVPLSIIRSYSLYTQQWYISYRFVDSFRVAAGSGWNCSTILILFESCLKTCMTYTIAVCTVNNSWWWTQELSETCRISFPKYIWEISASSRFNYKEMRFVIHLCPLFWFVCVAPKHLHFCHISNYLLAVFTPQFCSELWRDTTVCYISPNF
jgi:hypothetical protein